MERPRRRGKERVSPQARSSCVFSWCLGRGRIHCYIPAICAANQVFQFQTNKTLETLSLTPLVLSVNNRGGDPQPDIKLNGLLYKQGIVDGENIVNVLHFESGQWLLVPVTAKPNNKATVARQAAILHGATFIATGEAPGIERNAGKPTIDPIDTTPVLLSGGPLDDKYLKQIADTKPPHGFPEGSVKNPDLVLTNRLLTQEVLDYVQFCVSAKLDIPAAPPNSLNALSSGNVSPGISNIPFLDQNAQVREVNSTFYVEHVEGVGGSSFMQLQYTQRVILRFAGIDWPHVSVATLQRVLL